MGAFHLRKRTPPRRRIQARHASDRSHFEIAGDKRIYQHLSGLPAPTHPQKLVSDYRTQRWPTRNLATALRKHRTGTLSSPASWKAECPPRFHYEPKPNVQRLEVAECSLRWNTPRSCHS